MKYTLVPMLKDPLVEKYTLSPKKVDYQLMAVTLSKLRRFSEFVQRWKQEY